MRIYRCMVGLAGAVLVSLTAAAPITWADAADDSIVPSGPPELITCIVNEGCFTYPAPGNLFGGTGETGGGDTDPFGWFVQDLSYLSSLIDSLLSDLFKF